LLGTNAGPFSMPENSKLRTIDKAGSKPIRH
jgi:hypothetical protein